MTEALLQARPEDDPTYVPDDEFDTNIDPEIFLNNDGQLKRHVKTKELLANILNKGAKAKTIEALTVDYNDSEIKTLRALYMMAIVIWVLLIIGVGILNYKEGRLIYIIICFIPIAIFAYTFIILKSSKLSTQNVFKSNVVSIGLLFFFPLFAQMMTFNHVDILTFTKMMILGFSISLISLYDVWTDSRDNALLQHTKTILHTYAITLVLASLCFYYIIKSTQIKNGIPPTLTTMTQIQT